MNNNKTNTPNTNIYIVVIQASEGNSPIFVAQGEYANLFCQKPSDPQRDEDIPEAEIVEDEPTATPQPPAETESKTEEEPPAETEKEPNEEDAYSVDDDSTDDPGRTEKSQRPTFRYINYPGCTSAQALQTDQLLRDIAHTNPRTIAYMVRQQQLTQRLLPIDKYSDFVEAFNQAYGARLQSSSFRKAYRETIRQSRSRK